MFKEPLEIQPNTNYTAVSLKFLIIGRFCGEAWLKACVIRSAPWRDLTVITGPRGFERWHPSWMPWDENENCAGDGWLSQWREGDLPVQLCSRQQQWHVGGGRPDPWDYLLYLNLPLIIWLAYLARSIADMIKCSGEGVISEDASSSTHVYQWWQFCINMFHCMWSSAVWCKPTSEI